jgi:hypothetical protein
MAWKLWPHFVLIIFRFPVYSEFLFQFLSYVLINLCFNFSFLSFLLAIMKRINDYLLEIILKNKKKVVL